MDREWAEYFLEWSETHEFNKKLDEAKKIVKEALSKFKKPYIAFSGGKDSTALLHLVLSFDKNITVVHWDYGPYFVPRHIEKEIINIAKKCGAKNVIILTSHLYRKLGRKAKNVLGRHFLGIEVPKLAKSGYDCAFLGLRAEESVKRKIRTKKYFEKDEKTGITNVFPLRKWSWRDVWAYIVKNNINYLSLYDKYGPILGYDKARFVTLFDPEFSHFGTENVDKFLMWKYFKP